MGAFSEKYRDAIRRDLDALVDGKHPEMLTWVTGYPARLVRQPDQIWSKHTDFEAIDRDDGIAFGVVPVGRRRSGE